MREAATVAVVRDGARGLEVFMVRRTIDAVFSPGAHVFPGGALDPEDRTVELELRCDGLDDATASAIARACPPVGSATSSRRRASASKRRDCCSPAGDGELVTDADAATAATATR